MYVPTDSDRASYAGDVWLLRKYLVSLNSVIELRVYLSAKLHDNGLRISHTTPFTL